MKKEFLTYNQQMRYLRDEKKITCCGSKGKTVLITTGYFNLVNGYKNPFVDRIINGKHIYFPGTTIDELMYLKSFDDELRLLLLKYITKIEEEVRSLAAYSFDFNNQKGGLPWYSVESYDTTGDILKLLKLYLILFRKLIGVNKNMYVII